MMPKNSAKTHHPLAQAPLEELAAELARRKAALPKLLSRRDKLRVDLEQVEAQIATLQSLDGASPATQHGSGGGKGAKKSGKRKSTKTTRGVRKGEPSLREKIAEVLGTDPMRPVEIATALVDRGLHHGSKSLQIQVSTTLAKFEEFSKVARGQWVNGSRKNGS